MSDEETLAVSLTVNGERVSRTVPVRQHLVDFLRIELGLTGAHLGCEHGICGACSVRVDGVVVRGCLMLAVQADGAAVVTIEGLAANGTLTKVQKAWVELDVPQCGYCQSGMVMAATALLAAKPKPTDAEIDAAMTNICRCGTYQQVREAIHAAAAKA